MLYLSLDKKNIFIINFKCCYSSFESLAKKKKILKVRSVYKISNIEECKIWIITRHPYKRFLSFYKDKFIDSVISDNILRQSCQLNMLRFFNLKKITDKKMTISNLISAIKNGYKDSHLYLQSNVLKSNFFKSKKINFLKMEDKEFSNKCLSLIGSEIPKINSTNSGSLIKNLKSEEKSFLYDFYKDDFEKFSYEK